MPKETPEEAVSRMNTTLKYPGTPDPPVGSARAATVKRSSKPKDAGIILVTPEERVLVARFVRLIRSNYWLSHFFKNLLRLDSDSPDMVPISKVQEQLKQQEELEDLVGRVQYIGKQGWWRDHPAINAIVEEWDEVFEYRGDRAISNLIESAKQKGVKA